MRAVFLGWALVTSASAHAGYTISDINLAGLTLANPTTSIVSEALYANGGFERSEIDLSLVADGERITVDADWRFDARLFEPGFFVRNYSVAGSIAFTVTSPMPMGSSVIMHGSGYYFACSLDSPSGRIFLPLSDELVVDPGEYTLNLLFQWTVAADLTEQPPAWHDLGPERGHYHYQNTIPGPASVAILAGAMGVAVRRRRNSNQLADR